MLSRYPVYLGWKRKLVERTAHSTQLGDGFPLRRFTVHANDAVFVAKLIESLGRQIPLDFKKPLPGPTFSLGLRFE